MNTNMTHDEIEIRNGTRSAISARRAFRISQDEIASMLDVPVQKVSLFEKSFFLDPKRKAFIEEYVSIVEELVKERGTYHAR